MNELNKDNIFIGDFYMLNYCGIKVFFRVVKTTEDSVFLVELATKRYKNGITLTKKIKPSKSPLIITKNNSVRDTTYEVFPEQVEPNVFWLPIEIKNTSPLYRIAMYRDRIGFAPSGIAYAVPIRDVTNKYWVDDDTFDTDENIGLA